MGTGPVELRWLCARSSTQRDEPAGAGPRVHTRSRHQVELVAQRNGRSPAWSPSGNPFADDRAVADQVVAGPAGQGDVRLEIEIDGTPHVFEDWGPTTTLIEHLEAKGLEPSFSCREGQCSTCAVRLLEGEVKMLNNEVLDDGDLEDGIRLACQSLPVTDVVRVEYE